MHGTPRRRPDRRLCSAKRLMSQASQPSWNFHVFFFLSMPVVWRAKRYLFCKTTGCEGRQNVVLVGVCQPSILCFQDLHVPGAIVHSFIARPYHVVRDANHKVSIGFPSDEFFLARLFSLVPKWTKSRSQCNGITKYPFVPGVV